MHGDKIQEEIEKMQERRKAIWTDLGEHGTTLSAASQVVLISEVASIDVVISQMKKELEDMGWQEFMASLWNKEDPS